MRRFLRGLVIGGVLATLLFYPLLAPAPHRIDEAHFHLIAEGMTEADVEGIFGVPAGSYDWARPKDNHIYLITLLEAQQLHLEQLEQAAVDHKLGVRLAVRWLKETARQTKQWVGRHGAFAVTFDESGRVVGKHSAGSTEIVFPWREQWRRWIGW